MILFLSFLSFNMIFLYIFSIYTRIYKGFILFHYRSNNVSLLFSIMNFSRMILKILKRKKKEEEKIPVRSRSCNFCKCLNDLLGIFSNRLQGNSSSHNDLSSPRKASSGMSAKGLCLIRSLYRPKRQENDVNVRIASYVRMHRVT